MSARAVMVLGTASHVGKSLLVAALCRILRQDGVRVAPFKAQNMSLNSAATPEGLEIGRAQALQAEAAGIAATVDMNPILIKPSSECGAQVVVHGRVWGDTTAADYHRRRTLELFPLVVESYARLASAYDVIVLEGAGSPAEFNLRASDIVNMRMAEAADARCVLVGDIDRGGVFAALLGTLELLEPHERARIAGFIINKFRGDVDLLLPGVAEFEKRIGLPCSGVVPYLHDVGLDEEDSVAFDVERVARRPVWSDDAGPARRLRVAVVVLPQLANATDFAPLRDEPSVDFVFALAPEALTGADVVILPGTKTTLAARRRLAGAGFDEALREAPLLFGICGGLQILGERIDDPLGVEGGGAAAGLGFLPIRTTFAAAKVTTLVGGIAGANLFGSTEPEVPVRGYEIHMGETDVRGAAPFSRIVRGCDAQSSSERDASLNDGARSADGRVAGTYLHGIFDDDAFRHAFIRAAREARGLAPPRELAALAAERERRIDRLAAHVRASVDLAALMGGAFRGSVNPQASVRAKSGTR
jgi:adenosylcobyric acid synthase